MAFKSPFLISTTQLALVDNNQNSILHYVPREEIWHYHSCSKLCPNRGQGWQECGVMPSRSSLVRIQFFSSQYLNFRTDFYLKNKFYYKKIIMLLKCMWKQHSNKILYGKKIQLVHIVESMYLHTAYFDQLELDNICCRIRH